MILYASYRRRSARRGTVLISAIVVVSLLAVLATTYATMGMVSSRQVDRHSETFDVRSAGETIVAAGVHEIWSGYNAWVGGTPGMNTLKIYLDGLGIVASAGVGAPTGDEGIDCSTFLTLPEGGDAAFGMVDANLDALRVVRRDDGNTMTLYFTATVRSRRGDGANRTQISGAVQKAYTIEGGDWSGLDFALLANNVNCIMCHVTINSTDSYYNTDAALHGTYERIRVGTLESLKMRSSASSLIHGTLYVRGPAMDKEGNPITDWAAQTLNSVVWDSDGLIEQDAWGNPTVANLSPAGDPPDPLENLYLDYGFDDATMVDGNMPSSFPAPFPDDGAAGAGNRVVDPDEFDAVALTATGSLAGGTIFTVESGDPSIDDAADVKTALVTGNQTSLGSRTDGSVVLTGTEADPILLNGDITIDGDLVINGWVKGEGALWVSGNVYIPADLQYVDGTSDGTPEGDRTFGVNGATTNSLAIASGGSIIMGDMFHDKQGNSVVGFEDGSKNFGFAMSEVTLFNRAEWAKTQEYLPDNGESFDSPGTWSVKNPNYQGPDYFPRYYTFDEIGPVGIYVKGLYFDDTLGTWIGKEHGDKLDPTTNIIADPGDKSETLLYNPDGSPRAALHALTPLGDWLSDKMLEAIVVGAEAARGTGPRMIDALLYSNNSIFGLVPKRSSAVGQMIVNGAIVSADVGLLVPGEKGSAGLDLNYDPRVSQMISLPSDEGIEIHESMWLGAPEGP